VESLFAVCVLQWAERVGTAVRLLTPPKLQNELPVITSPSSFLLPENAGRNFVVYRASSTDSDFFDYGTFSVTGTCRGGTVAVSTVLLHE
jgi:hypothetical protein